MLGREIRAWLTASAAPERYGIMSLPEIDRPDHPIHFPSFRSNTGPEKGDDFHYIEGWMYRCQIVVRITRGAVEFRLKGGGLGDAFADWEEVDGEWCLQNCGDTHGRIRCEQISGNYVTWSGPDGITFDTCVDNDFFRIINPVIREDVGWLALRKPVGEPPSRGHVWYPIGHGKERKWGWVRK